MKRTTRFGVNYTFSKNWMYSWVDWDSQQVLEDFQALSSLGIDHLRVPILWTVFQPNANYVSETALNRLYELLDLADKCGLDIAVSVLTGWLCGFTFFPEWKIGKNMFTEREIIEAEKLLFKSITDKIGKHKRFMGFDIGNELSVLGHGENKHTIQEGDIWLQEIMDYCEEIAPGKLCVNGVDHKPWFKDEGFSRRGLANIGTTTSVHAWIYFTGGTEIYNPLDVGCTYFAEYCIELANAYATDVNRKVWLQEFGASAEWMPALHVPEFMELTMKSIFTCENLWGVTWWCAHDIDVRFKGFDKLEYGMGLFDYNNKIKPQGERYAKLIKEYKQKPPEKIKREKAIVLPDNFLSIDHGDMKWNWRLANPFMDLIKEGERPTIILESMTENKEYIASRGIKELIKINKI